ncbi:uncharacterized protein LOC111046286 [Nilaparvata lugens]|uniref:uncharacterized protein LOC111046286 n=1 Tax=Nilaparvata lugens TaxID=108931 RepID=UPI00193D5611|nr:uncharacterized protein LOC111046286 [Nilaparvata lugens]
MPGEEWFTNFMGRHPSLSERMSQNIKRVRAGVSRDTISNYFVELEKSLEGIPSSNIINYDETNFTDDPGNVKVIVKRGSKHTERILDTSKTSISVMFAGAGDGTMLPPYVIYKAKHLYPTWVENGPDGVCFNRNTSGWMDLEMFEEWFQRIILPYARKLTGEIALIGDNLSSHISLEVVRMCEENNIKFVLLPPNSTHICQPLDVAFFHPIKNAWRKVLGSWKEKNRGVLPKSVFPSLLRETIESIGLTCADNIRSGFRACGIVPLDSDRVLNKLPHDHEVEEGADEDEAGERWSESFTEVLKKFRESDQPPTQQGRGKRLNIVPGKSISASDVAPGTSSSGGQQQQSPPREEEEPVEPIEEEQPGIEEEQPGEDTSSVNYSVGDFVVVKFSTENSSNLRFWVGNIVKIIDENLLEISFLRTRILQKNNFSSFSS